MKTTLRIATVAALAFAALTANASVETYRAHGTVVAVDQAKSTITVQQNSVTSLGWPARTMTYTADGSNVLKNISVGQTVDVKFTADNAFNADAHFVTPVSQ